MLEITIQRGSTDPVFTRDLGFGCTGEGCVADLAELVALEGAGPALVGPALLRGGDPVSLALTLL
ncbi:hypothetical protein GCM10009591_36310 [Brachybacterium tyrofermentans]